MFYKFPNLHITSLEDFGTLAQIHLKRNSFSFLLLFLRHFKIRTGNLLGSRLLNSYFASCKIVVKMGTYVFYMNMDMDMDILNVLLLVIVREHKVMNKTD